MQAKTSYLDFLLAENTLTDDQVTMLVWEAIIEGADTTLVTTEWAMYELAKNPEKQASYSYPSKLLDALGHAFLTPDFSWQDRLYREIQEVCGEDMVTEDHLPRLPYLNAVFHETLRRHSPVSLLPPRFAHETTTLAGYEVQAGTEVIFFSKDTAHHNGRRTLMQVLSAHKNDLYVLTFAR